MCLSENGFAQDLHVLRALIEDVMPKADDGSVRPYRCSEDFIQACPPTPDAPIYTSSASLPSHPPAVELSAFRQDLDVDSARRSRAMSTEQRLQLAGFKARCAAQLAAKA